MSEGGGAGVPCGREASFSAKTFPAKSFRGPVCRAVSSFWARWAAGIIFPSDGLGLSQRRMQHPKQNNTYSSFGV